QLAATGSFIGGTYRWPDGREQDAFEATVEHMTGAPVKYPEPRYDRPIRMRVSAYRPVATKDEPGLVVRRLASFNEVGPDISFVEAESGSKMPAGKSCRTDVRFMLDGEAQFDGREFSGLSCFFFPSDQPHDAITAKSKCRFLQVRFGTEEE
ncbi:MAG TPA: hypothetical protein VN905_10630, partial [Candidatus Binatia bacterium]|nr:hypothetical protein [Candidatus Binatia bacterium]